MAKDQFSFDIVSEVDLQEVRNAVDQASREISQRFDFKGTGTTMELKEEEIVNKVGGRFKLSTLIQKRMIALNQGARALVDGRGVDKMTMVIREIMQDKIYLDLSGRVQTNEPTEELESDGGTVDLTQSPD